MNPLHELTLKQMAWTSTDEEIRFYEEECARLWGEAEPILRAHDAVQKRLIELYRKES